MTGSTDDDAVLAANQAFYDAHEAADVESMSALWDQTDRAVCVHPGWTILRGWDAVRESWQRIFDGPGQNQFILTNLAVVVVGDTGWVTLDENLMDRGNTGAIAATNVFVRRGADWKLVLHHGSPIMSG